MLTYHHATTVCDAVSLRACALAPRKDRGYTGTKIDVTDGHAEAGFAPVQFAQSPFQPLPVLSPRRPVHARCRLALQRVIGSLQRFRRDVVQRRESLLRFPLNELCRIRSGAWVTVPRFCVLGPCFVFADSPLVLALRSTGFAGFSATMAMS